MQFKGGLYRLEIFGIIYDVGRRTKDERRTTKDERRITKDERRTTKDERRRTKDEDLRSFRVPFAFLSRPFAFLSRSFRALSRSFRALSRSFRALSRPFAFLSRYTNNSTEKKNMSAFSKPAFEDPGSLWLDPTRRDRVNIPPVPPPEQSPGESVQNFRMVFLGYNEEQAIVEATRCIHCPKPEPCIVACPLHNDIPSALLAIEEKRYEDAANIFRATSNLPEVCGRLCPQEILCEGSCTVGGYDRPVNIGKLEAFCADWQRERHGFPQPPVVSPTGRRVAVVGSGPAGLAVAEELTRVGHTVVVYEEWPLPGGLLRYGIPSFKLAKHIVVEKIAYLESLGITFVCNTRIGRDIPFDDLYRQYDAVFLGIGAPVSHRIALPGEELQGIYTATEFLARGNLPPEDLPPSMREPLQVGETMVIIGGGDTAVDCVRTARRLQVQHGITEGCVVDYYRGAEFEMRARAEEYAHALAEGARYEFLTTPIRFIGDERGHVCQIEMQRMRAKPSDQPAQRKPSRIRIPIPGSNFIVPADVVVLAIGYEGDPLIPTQVPVLKTTAPGIFKVESVETGRTTLEGIFAAGDDVHGADLIVTAVAAGRFVARAIDEYLKSK
jgi:glutamate synthase (NADPH/NADH) small chain